MEKSEKRMRYLLVFLFSILFTFVNAQSTDSIVNTTNVSNQDSIQKINYKDLAVVGTIIPVTATGVYIYLNNAWWADKRVPFHITDKLELKYALNLDKAGHFMSSCFVSTIFSDVLLLTGIPEKYSVWGGASLSFINATIVEIKDGFSPYWGFSKYDELANLSGALYPVLQYYVPFFRNIDFCWSYDFSHPSYYKSMPGHENKSFIDDYERQNFWMTFDVANMFYEDKNHKKFPYFLDPGFGMSAQNIDGKGAGIYEWFICVNINLTKLQFTKSKFEPVAYKYLHFYHLPSPAFRLHPKVTAYPITY